MSDGPAPLAEWSIPSLDASEACVIRAFAGMATIVVGANGSGKSALSWSMAQTAGPVNVQRLIAHRRLWFEAPGPSLNAAERANATTNFRHWGESPDSRYLDHGTAQRPAVVLFDLLAKLNYENASIADQVYSGVDSPSIRTVAGDRLLDRLNRVFSGAGFDIRIRLTVDATFEADHLTRNSQCPVSQMSDGEKSALLLTAEVMSAPQGTVFIIDEPERHLHRGISAGLIEAVVSDRPDCHFVIITHDLDLAAEFPDGASQKFVLSDVAWRGENAIGWSLREVPQSGLPEDIKRAVFGGRKRILLIEGHSQSLDMSLYSILYPGRTPIPVGSCEQVIRVVSGLRASDHQHWLRACGVVDSDARSLEETAQLAARGVKVLPLSEIESLYYSNPVLRQVAEVQAKVRGLNADELLEQAEAAGLDALRARDVPERLCASVAEKMLYRSAFNRLPNRMELQSGQEQFSVVLESPYSGLLAQLKTDLATNNWTAIIRNFPIKDSGARKGIARALHFTGYPDYEVVARQLIRNNDHLIEMCRTLVGTLPD